MVLGTDWKGGPLFRWGQVTRWERGTFNGHRPWPLEVGLDAVSNEGKHGNTSVLDFSVTEEADGGFISLVPEIISRKTKRIVELDDRVQFLGHSLQISLSICIEGNMDV